MNPDVNIWMMMLKSVVMLCVVLGLLIAILYIMKRISTKRWSGTGQGLIKTLATHHISPKERIILLDVLGERILIGSTPQSINSLAVLNEDGEIELTNDAPVNIFDGFLKKAISKKFNKEKKEDVDKTSDQKKIDEDVMR